MGDPRIKKIPKNAHSPYVCEELVGGWGGFVNPHLTVEHRPSLKYTVFKAHKPYSHTYPRVCLCANMPLIIYNNISSHSKLCWTSLKSQISDQKQISLSISIFMATSNISSAFVWILKWHWMKPCEYLLRYVNLENLQKNRWSTLLSIRFFLWSRDSNF